MSYFRYLSLAVILSLGAALWPSAALAQLEVDITEGHLNPLPVAVTNFELIADQPSTIGDDVSGVIRANLERSGLFRSIDPQAFINQSPNIDYRPQYRDWRVLGADALVLGRISIDSSARVRVEYRLWDIVNETQLAGQVYGTTEDNWRRIAHKISDSIYEKLTGESGYFDTRLVFVSESGPKNRRVKRLAIMDQDGANPQYLTGGDYLVLTPRFSPAAQTITYLSYESGQPQVFLREIGSQEREALGNFPGMTFAPRFSPDGRYVVMALSRSGNTDIYRMNLASGQTERLTSNPGIDTSPSYSPDGRRIVFNSSRGGTPQLYVMNADGSNVKRISFGDGRYTAPVWSPRGDLVAFTKSNKGNYHIGVLDPDNPRDERLLTQSYLDEGPTWAPNGRVLMFTRESRGVNGRSEIWSVDLTGKNLRRVPTPGAASDPAWSPLLQ